MEKNEIHIKDTEEKFHEHTETHLQTHRLQGLKIICRVSQQSHFDNWIQIPRKHLFLLKLWQSLNYNSLKNMLHLQDRGSRLWIPFRKSLPPQGKPGREEVYTSSRRTPGCPSPRWWQRCAVRVICPLPSLMWGCANNHGYLNCLIIWIARRKQNPANEWVRKVTSKVKLPLFSVEMRVPWCPESFLQVPMGLGPSPFFAP